MRQQLRERSNLAPSRSRGEKRRQLRILSEDDDDNDDDEEEEER